jgi:general secretion pathway protein D
MNYLAYFHPDAARHKPAFGLFITAILMAALAGCASERVFESCNSLPDRERAEEGLVRVQELLRQDPQSVGCQRAQLLLRERLVTGYMRRAEQERQEGRGPNAVALYRRVLELQPGHTDAKTGLVTLERTERTVEWIAQARAAMRTQEWGQARSQLESVLRLDVNHAEARQLLAEIARLSRPAQVDNGLAAIFKKPISIEFRDMPIRMVFDAISKGSGLNFVFDKDVKTDQKVSIFLRDSTVESALYFLMLTNQLEQQVMNGNTILIYPNSPTKQKEYQELNVRTFQLINADAKTVAAALKTLFKGRDMVVDEKLNMITMRDTPEAVRAVEKLIALHDVAEPEVMLEVEILEVSRDKLLSLGVDLPDNISFSPLASGIAGLTLSDLQNLNANTTKVGVGAVTINAKNTNGDVNTLANPRIRVVNREKARVLIGDRIPIVTTVVANTVSSQTVSYIDIGLKLDVEPIIYGGNEVVLKMGLEVSSLGPKIGDYYTFGTRNANTTLRLRDGENQVLAGLIKDEDRRTSSKVPGVGEMPIVGRLFGTQQDSGNKTEIVLSITPRLTRRGSFADAVANEFRSGTESSMRERPLPVEATVSSSSAKASVSQGSTLSAPPVAFVPPPQAPAPKPESVGIAPVQVPAPAPAPLPLLASKPRVEPPAPPTPLTPSPVPPPLPSSPERELANIAISALKNFNLAQQVSPPETTSTGATTLGANQPAPVQGGQ